MSRIQKFLWGVLGVFATIVLFVNLTVHALSAPYTYNDVARAPNAEVVLIPGAALADQNTPAPIFIDRADTAIALYQAGKVSKILISGDSRNTDHNEVDPMRLYILSKDVPDSDIVLDHAGLNTYDSMYRARTIFGFTSMLIASQSFHLPRAVFIARSLGIDAYGVNADQGNILFSNYLREVFSDEKAVFDVVFKVQPESTETMTSATTTTTMP